MPASGGGRGSWYHRGPLVLSPAKEPEGIRKKRVRKPPIIVQLTPESVRCARGIHRLFAEQPRWSRNQVRILNAMFDFKSDERAFARALLEQKPHLWVFRCNQQRFCGDFILIDMSCPDIEGRRVLALEMKERGRLKVGSGAGFQLRNAARAVAAISRETGIVVEGAPFETVVGGKGELASFLGLAHEPEGEAVTGSEWPDRDGSMIAFPAEKC